MEHSGEAKRPRLELEQSAQSEVHGLTKFKCAGHAVIAAHRFQVTRSGLVAVAEGCWGQVGASTGSPLTSGTAIEALKAWDIHASRTNAPSSSSLGGASSSSSSAAAAAAAASSRAAAAAAAPDDDGTSGDAGGSQEDRERLLAFASKLTEVELSHLLEGKQVDEIRSAQGVNVAYRVGVFLGENISAYLTLRIGGQRTQVASEDAGSVSSMLVGTTEIKVCGVEERALESYYKAMAPGESLEELQGHLAVLTKFSISPGRTFHSPRNSPFAMKAVSGDCLEIRVNTLLGPRQNPRASYFGKHSTLVRCKWMR